MKKRLQLYDIDGRRLSLPPGWRLSKAGNRHWLAQGGLMIPLPESLPAQPSHFSAKDLDAIHRAVDGARWCDPSVPQSADGETKS